MIRSKIAMGFLWSLLTLALHVWPGAVSPAYAQGSRKDDIVFNTRGIPLAGATIRVCAMPASGQPCTPLALIYSDSSLTQALANPNTTVVGKLASGTLNLANQSTPPGAAGAGTVNLYTKTTDKRLYYKDDTGAEIGPIASGSGAQTNVPNTFTAQQN